MSDEKLYQIALALVPKVGSVLTRQLVAYCGSARAVLSAPKGQLLKIPGVGTYIADQVRRADHLTHAEAELKRAERAGVHLLYFTEPTYPERLKRVPDSPPLLYYAGTADLNPARTVAVVGTRRATEYGRRVTENLVRDLQPYGCTIVSGLAYGIDITAHRAALQYDLPTIGVMASGIDIIYPAAHRATARQMEQTGGVLTENAFGTKPDAPLFPARNRIIAGLSDVVVLVESAARGGGLITARMANDYHREAMAVPGPLDAPFSEGCHRLVANHEAALYTGVESLINLLGWDEATTGAPKDALQTSLFTEQSFSPDEWKVLEVLRAQKAVQIDDLSYTTRLAISSLASLLLQLEFRGVVQVLPGKKYTLRDAAR